MFNTKNTNLQGAGSNEQLFSSVIQNIKHEDDYLLEKVHKEHYQQK